MVGELVSDDAKKPWFLLLMFLTLPLAIWLSLQLPALADSDPGYVKTLQSLADSIIL